MATRFIASPWLSLLSLRLRKNQIGNLYYLLKPESQAGCLEERLLNSHEKYGEAGAQSCAWSQNHQQIC